MLGNEDTICLASHYVYTLLRTLLSDHRYINYADVLCVLRLYRHCVLTAMCINININLMSCINTYTAVHIKEVLENATNAK
jgi:hypothetical protein